jgi:hypothetical protein
MQSPLLISMVLMFLSQSGFALPEFTGMRDDDEPILGRHGGIHAKNINAGIPDIEDIELASEEMIVRIYADHRTQMVGGHPYDLKEVRVKNDAVSMLWYPNCRGEPEKPHASSDNTCRVLQEQDFFSIRDYRNFPPRTFIVDGQVQQSATADGNYYVVQIKTAGAYRQFAFSTDAIHVAGSQDARGFLTSLGAISAEFGTPACYRDRPSRTEIKFGLNPP